MYLRENIEVQQFAALQSGGLGVANLTCGDFFINRFAKRSRDTVAAAWSRWISRQEMLPPGSSRAGFAAKETERRGDSAVTNHGYDSQRGSFPRKSLHM